MTKLRLSTTYFQISIQFGSRTPLKFNTVKNNLFRAVEYNVGIYTSSPLLQKLDHPDNIDVIGDLSAFNYFRFGSIGEIVFTAFNSKGHGHKFGIRFSNDFTNIAKIRDTLAELYPFFHTVGVFYNIMNTYYK